LKGKILADDAAVGTIGAGEKDFIVVMVTKVCGWNISVRSEDGSIEFTALGGND
jgi:hypothetical protein